MFLTSLSLLTDRPTTGWRAVARRSSCASISIPNRWRGFLRLQVIIARRLSLLSTHWGRCKLSTANQAASARLAGRLGQLASGRRPGIRGSGVATWQEHGLKRRVSSCSAWISMPRAHSGGSSARMQSYGLGTMPYRDWFCSTERVRSPGGIIGLASGAGI